MASEGGVRETEKCWRGGPPFCPDPWRGEREHNPSGDFLGAGHFLLFEILCKVNFTQNSNKLTSGKHVVVENNLKFSFLGDVDFFISSQTIHTLIIFRTL